MSPTFTLNPMVKGGFSSKSWEAEGLSFKKFKKKNGKFQLHLFKNTSSFIDVEQPPSKTLATLSHVPFLTPFFKNVAEKKNKRSRLDATEAGWEEEAALEVAFTELIFQRSLGVGYSHHGEIQDINRVNRC